MLNPTHAPDDSVTEASYCLTAGTANCYNGELETASYNIY